MPCLAKLRAVIVEDAYQTGLSHSVGPLDHWQTSRLLQIGLMGTQSTVST